MPYVLSVLHILTLSLLGIPVFIFLFYGVVLFYFSRKKEDEIDYKSVEFEPEVSIVIPTHNEELVISKKIDNMLHLDYPTDKLEIIFVDDSVDNTAKIIEEYSGRFPYISLIRFNVRMGYSPSMIAGCRAAKKEIIVYTEAGSFMDEQAIRKLVRHFKNPNIGLVTGRSAILNTNEEVGEAEKSYVNVANFLRRAESHMDSTFWVKGEATAVRKELITDLADCNATFDNTSALFVRKKGYKSIYDPEVKFYEYAPTTYKDWGKQKTIRAANWIKMLLRFKSMFFRRKYGLFGCITLPIQFSMLVVVPILLPLGIMSLVALTFLDLSFSLTVWGILGFIVMLSLILNRKLLMTFLEFEHALLKAIYQVSFTKTEHDKIDKVVSTRSHAMQ
jgi:cellulose synthase/poly-beta-1,6-N-acetylglucosamine synthase-like glycosyltransferase